MIYDEYVILCYKECVETLLSNVYLFNVDLLFIELPVLLVQTKCIILVHIKYCLWCKWNICWHIYEMLGGGKAKHHNWGFHSDFTESANKAWCLMETYSFRIWNVSLSSQLGSSDFKIKWCRKIGTVIVITVYVIFL